MNKADWLILNAQNIDIQQIKSRFELLKTAFFVKILRGLLLYNRFDISRLWVKKTSFQTQWFESSFSIIQFLFYS
jgi:hypothetical protein